MDAQTDEQVKPYCLKGYLNSAMIVMNNMLSGGAVSGVLSRSAGGDLEI